MVPGDYYRLEVLYLAVGFPVVLGGGSCMVMSSSGCAGREPTGREARLSAMSRPVSEAVQKYAGLSTHPICKHNGTTSCVLSFGASLGRT